LQRRIGEVNVDVLVTGPKQIPRGFGYWQRSAICRRFAARLGWFAAKIGWFAAPLVRFPARRRFRSVEAAA
jgi:hypothetical protein